MILSNFNGREVNLKPYVCGNTDFIIEEDLDPGMYVCSIGCTSKTCTHIVNQVGHSKQVAFDKAVRTWNKE